MPRNLVASKQGHHNLQADQIKLGVSVCTCSPTMLFDTHVLMVGQPKMKILNVSLELLGKGACDYEKPEAHYIHSKSHNQVAYGQSKIAAVLLQ